MGLDQNKYLATNDEGVVLHKGISLQGDGGHKIDVIADQSIGGKPHHQGHNQAQVPTERSLNIS